MAKKAQVLFADRVPWRRGRPGWRVWMKDVLRVSERQVAEVAAFERDVHKGAESVVLEVYSTVEAAQAALCRQLQAERALLVARQERDLAELDTKIARLQGVKKVEGEALLEARLGCAQEVVDLCAADPVLRRQAMVAFAFIMQHWALAPLMRQMEPEVSFLRYQEAYIQKKVDELKELVRQRVGKEAQDAGG